MGFNFPEAPTQDQVFWPAGGPKYIYKSPRWLVYVENALVSDTPPSNPLPGQFWYESDTGNTYIWYADIDSQQWVQQNVGQTDWNTLTNVPGTFPPQPHDHARIMNGGGWASVDTAGVLTVAGNIQSNGTVYHGNAAQVLLSTTGSGTVYLRPNADGTKQVTIDANGSIVLPGTATTNLNYYCAGGQFNSLTTWVGLCTTGAGNCVMRPHGAGSSYAEVSISSTGQLASHISPTVFNGNTDRRGFNGASGPQNHSFYWNNTAMEVYVGTVGVGNMGGVSDYRIKKDVADLPSTWEQVKALRPISYTQVEFQPPMSAEKKAINLKAEILGYAVHNNLNPEDVSEKDLPPKPAPAPMFIESDDVQWGFIAHELQETLVESAATGVKDMEDGVQAPNPWTLLAAAVKTIQELQVRVEALEAASGV